MRKAQPLKINQPLRGIVFHQDVAVEVRDGTALVVDVVHLDAADQTLRSTPSSLTTAVHVRPSGVQFRWRFDEETEVIAPTTLSSEWETWHPHHHSEPIPHDQTVELDLTLHLETLSQQ